MKIKKFVCIIIICLISCSTQHRKNNFNSYPPEGYVPVDLYDAIEYLNCIMSEECKQKIVRYFEKEEIEVDSLGDEPIEIEILEDENLEKTFVEDEDFMLFLFYYDFGRNIRNTWGLWSGENDLVKFFNSYEIFHPDDMSSIILLSFYRKMKNKEIDFEGQVQEFLDYWKPILETEKKETKRALETYDKYNLGNAITIYMQVDTITLNAGIPHYEWIYNSEKDLKIRGKIIQKEIIQDSTDVRLLTQILDINRNRITILGKNVKAADTIEMRLKFSEV